MTKLYLDVFFAFDWDGFEIWDLAPVLHCWPISWVKHTFFFSSTLYIHVPLHIKKHQHIGEAYISGERRLISSSLNYAEGHQCPINPLCHHYLFFILGFWPFGAVPCYLFSYLQASKSNSFRLLLQKKLQFAPFPTSQGISVFVSSFTLVVISFER